jgi:hypothetical protein
MNFSPIDRLVSPRAARCAATYDSCDLCLDPSCQWCSTDSTGVNGFCVERTGVVRISGLARFNLVRPNRDPVVQPFVCGGGLGLKTSTCGRNCTDAVCDNKPWYNSCSGNELVTLFGLCDATSGKCRSSGSASRCQYGCCWNKDTDMAKCC